MSSLIEKWRIYRHPDLLAILALGFASGLPFLLTLSTLSFWLAESGVSKTAIGMFMFVTLPYCVKFMWAPFLDRCRIPGVTDRLGQRRGWAFVSQVCLMIALVAMGMTDPTQNLWLTALCATIVSFCAATQDIVIDAYRIEILKPEYGGAGAAVESIGFRFGMIASGACALYFAHMFGWTTSYMIMAGCVSVGMITVLLMPEPRHESIIPLQAQLKDQSILKQLSVLFLNPIRQFSYKRDLVYILAFILFFKTADTVLNAMSAPFLSEIGFSKIEFANISKVFGTGLMVAGGLIAGVLISQFGTLNTLVMCIALQVVSSFMFAIQAIVGHDMSVLMITVGVESFCSGMISAAFIAYLSSFCSQPHTATHFTLLYSFGSLSRVIVSAGSGWLADHVSWTMLFCLTALAGVPAIVLLSHITKPEALDKPVEKPSKIKQVK